MDLLTNNCGSDLIFTFAIFGIGNLALQAIQTLGQFRSFFDYKFLRLGGSHSALFLACMAKDGMQLSVLQSPEQTQDVPNRPRPLGTKLRTDPDIMGLRTRRVAEGVTQ